MLKFAYFSSPYVCKMVPFDLKSVFFLHISNCNIHIKMSKRKLSGAENRRNAQKREASNKDLLQKVPKLTSFFGPSPSTSSATSKSTCPSTANEVRPYIIVYVVHYISEYDSS